jgi:hypothetical protein
MSEQITPLELTALKMIAARGKKHKQLMLNQIEHAYVMSRKRSSSGFITNFLLPDDIPTLNTMSQSKLLEIYAEHDNVPSGAAFLLWFEHGRLKYLEAYSFIGKWPSNELGFHFETNYDSLSSELIRTKQTNNYSY